MSRSKQYRRCTSRSCWHCNACMLICLKKGMAFAGHCTQVVPISEDRRRKSKLNTTSGGGYVEAKVKQNRAADIRHVGIAVHA